MPVVQTLHRAVRVPGCAAPFDTAHVTVRHPAHADRPIDAIGTLAAAGGPKSVPVVVFAPGTNVEPAYYRWLATALVDAGYAVVTYAVVGPVPPEAYGITPGIDLSAVTPERFGRSPVAPVLRQVLDLLLEANATAPLDGTLDLDRVALGGHSAGGTAALLSADHGVLPEARAVFAYGAHTMASPLLGWPPGTVLPLSGDCPVLLIGGSNDGVVGSSDPLARSFATLADRPAAIGSWQVTISGANHFSLLAPDDGGWPRTSDRPASLSGPIARRIVANLISLFLEQHLRPNPAAATAFEAYVATQMVVTATPQLATPVLTTKR